MARPGEARTFWTPYIYAHSLIEEFTNDYPRMDSKENVNKNLKGKDSYRKSNPSAITRKSADAKSDISREVLNGEI
jgi:hypothetical protein